MNALYTAAVLGVALSLGCLVRWIWGLVKRRRRKMEITIGEVDMPYSTKGESVSIYTDPNTIMETKDGERMKLQALQLRQQAMAHEAALQPQKFFINEGTLSRIEASLNMYPALHEHLQAGRQSVKQQLTEWLKSVSKLIGKAQSELEEEKKLSHERQEQLIVLDGEMVDLKKKLATQQRFLGKIGGIVEMQVNLLPMDLEDNDKPLGAPTRFQLGPFETREVLRLYWDMVADEVDAKIGKGRKPELTDGDMESVSKPIEWPQKMSLTMGPPEVIDFSMRKGVWNAAAR